MPSTTSSSLSRLFASSTVITPSLPTFCMASAIMSPIAFSPLAEMVPTWAIARTADLLGALLDLLDHVDNGLLDAALEIHRIHAGGDCLQAFAYDGLSEHRRGGGAVARGVVGLGRDFLQHLRAHILELVFELDLLGYGDAVLGRARCAERFFENDVAALGPKRDLDRVGQDIDAAHHPLTRVGGKLHIFSCHLNSLRCSIFGVGE